ncbi:MAG: acryloyl-CoA reductase [Dehalococcoidia bacterium]
MSFRAYVLTKEADAVNGAVTDFDEAALMPGEVTIRVEWSGVNYKDGLACSATGRVVRNYPMIPGIDIAGTVSASADTSFKAGDKVVAIGYDIGISHFGGYAEMARLPAKWVCHLPAGLTTKEAAAIGTAGFTAAQSVEALENHGVTPASGPVLVTGATGGVGSTAVAMLAQLGHTVAASTGKASEHDYLRALGATEILAREEVAAESNRPLEGERWAGAVDPVGGTTTAYLLRTTKYGGSVALSGLTGGTAVPTAVFPFILRGVNLLGIDSVNIPVATRVPLWARLATDLKPKGLLESIAHETGLAGVGDATRQILTGTIKGRVLINVNA